MLLFPRILPLVRILAILDHIWGSKDPKTFQNGHFMDAESTRKTLKTFDLTTTNAILMKLTTIIYLYGSVSRKPLRNSVFWHNFYEFLDYIKNHHICHALSFIVSLVKFYANSMKNYSK